MLQSSSGWLKKVAEIIVDGDSLLLDIGSTTAYVALALRNHQNLYIVTHSLAVSHSLATRNNNRVFFAGVSCGLIMVVPLE